MNIRLLILIAVFLYLSTLSFSEISYISGCTVINSPGTYLLTSDINDNRYTEQINAIHVCILINSNDVFLDCQSHTIKGFSPSSSVKYAGISTRGRTNIVIANCKVEHYYYGFGIYDSTNFTVINNTAENNSYGFYIYHSTNFAVINNIANNNSYGFGICSSDKPSTNFTLINNTANNNNYGFDIYSSGYRGFYFPSANFALINNTANNNSYGFHIYYSVNVTLLDNTLCYNNRSDINLEMVSLQKRSNNMCDKIEDDQHVFQCIYKCSEQRKNQGELLAEEKQPEKVENSITAPNEYPSGSKCDSKSDGKCDPNCKTEDPDCNSPLNPKSNLCCPLPLIFAVLILLYLSITKQTSSYRS